jgi:hypothetical protein
MRIADIVRRGQRGGELREGADAEGIAMFIIAILKGR